MTEYLDANLLLSAVEARETIPRDLEVDEHTEDCVIAAMRLQGMRPLEILNKYPRYTAAVRLIRVLRHVIDQQG